MAKETARDRNGIYFERLASELERRAYKRADLIVAISEKLADQIVSFAGVPRNKILVVPNAIPSDLISVQRQNNGEFIVGFSGSLVPWQQLEKLISAFDRCRKTDDKFEQQVVIEIIGDGPVKESLIRLVEDLGLNQIVRFLPRMPQYELFNRMATWSVGFAGHEKSSSNVMYHSPLKMYEYAGLGLSAVSTMTPDAAALKAAGMKVHYFDDLQELSDALLKSFYDPISQPENDKQRLEIYSKHSWRDRTDKVLAVIATRFEMMPCER